MQRKIEFKITGSFFNPGPYSGWLAMVFPMVLGYAIFYRKGHKDSQSLPACIFHFLTAKSAKLYKIYRLLMTVLCCLTVSCMILVLVLVLPAAMNRASWLAALGGSAFVGIMHVLRNKKFSGYYI
jgi:hypothetical protein